MKEKELELILAGWSIPDQTKYDIRDTYGEAHYLVESFDWLVVESHLDVQLDYDVKPMNITRRVTSNDVDMFVQPVISAQFQYSGEDDGVEGRIEANGEQINTEAKRGAFVENTPATPEDAIDAIRERIDEKNLDLELEESYTDEDNRMVDVKLSSVKIE